MPEIWQSEAERLKFDDGLSWREVAVKLQHYFPGDDIHKIHETVRRKLRDCDRYKKATADKPVTAKKPVGVFSDPHIPFNHPNYLRFCSDTFKAYGVGQVVCCGDLVDNHAISRHLKETSAKSACDELDMSIAETRKFAAEFPDVKLCLGNHDDRIIAQAATVGIDRRFLKSFKELLELPKTWEISDEWIIDDVLYKHGTGCSGVNAALNCAISERMSTVIGHIHSNGCCDYSANKRNMIFGLSIGCGIDIAAYAFAYGKHEKKRPVLGCGIVFDSSRAIFEPMRPEYFRD